MDYSQYNLEKTGYLKEDFRLFHINDQTKKIFLIIIMIFIKSLFLFPGSNLSYRRKSVSSETTGYSACQPGCDPQTRDWSIGSVWALYFLDSWWSFLPGIEYLLSKSKRSQFQPCKSRFCPAGTSERSASRNRADLTEQTFWRYSTEKCAVYSIHDIYQPDFSSYEQFPRQKNIFLWHTGRTAPEIYQSQSVRKSLNWSACQSIFFQQISYDAKIQKWDRLYYPQLYYQ